MEKKNLRIKKEKLTNHITYSIIENTIYLFFDDDAFFDELNMVMKKISLLVIDNDLSYVNISTKNMEKKKDFYHDLGFVFSYYDISKLNTLYYDKKNKIDYRCYGLMTRKDFLDRLENKEITLNKRKNADIKNATDSNSGYVDSFLLLFGGILLLCYFCVQGAIYLVK